METAKFDLHVHTTASDGSLNAKQIIAEAKRIGLTTIAITDHDTIGNVKECIELVANPIHNMDTLYKGRCLL